MFVVSQCLSSQMKGTRRGGTVCKEEAVQQQHEAGLGRRRHRRLVLR